MHFSRASKRIKSSYEKFFQVYLPLTRYRLSAESRKWYALKNKYQGQRCFIIGNGPSLKSQNLALLSNEVTFVTNWFVLHPDFEVINPDFYCICAHEVFGTPTDAYVRWRKEVDFEDRLYSLLRSNARNSTKVFPFYFRDGIRRKHLFDGESLMYLFFEPPVKAVHQVNSMNFDIGNQRLNSGETVIINFCLPIAYYLGFAEIYLIGCDCDYGQTKPGDPRSYFYNSSDQSGSSPSFEWLQRSWAEEGPMMQSYRVAHREFSRQDRKIYNATAGGKLEVFPRVSYESLFNDVN